MRTRAKDYSLLTADSVKSKVAQPATSKSTTVKSATKRNETDVSRNQSRPPIFNTLESIAANIAAASEQAGEKRKVIILRPHRRKAYGYVLNPVWVKAKTLVNEKGRRLWNTYTCYEVEHMYIRDHLLGPAGMRCTRDKLTWQKGIGPTFGIYWRSNFDLFCVAPPPEVEKAGVEKLKALLGVTFEPRWFYMSI
ncbi:hypothetical protein C8Q75DRAFT_863260 [Abortiporus biennis]|nr:hypothetical protein C8Q75DRAFT_863260 [Abortiporus biennis]